MIGSTVSITGTGFDSVILNDTVMFNGKQAIVSSATATSLNVVVPIKAKSGPITLSIGGQTVASTSSFIIAVPTIDNFTPLAGTTGSLVTINGTNFSTNPSLDTVRINGFLAQIISATSTALMVVVPSNATSGSISISVGGGQISSSSQTFCVKPQKPRIRLGSSGSEPILTSSATAGNQWFLDGDVLSNAVDQSIPIKAPGNYAVQVIFGTCQSDTSDPFVVTGDVKTTFGKTNLMLYPNPATSYLNISVENSQAQSDITIQVFDILGQPLLQKVIWFDTSNLDLTNFAPGTYLIRAIQSGNIYSKFFIKQ
jgi:uncharacterized protein (TIGR03437 family)